MTFAEAQVELIRHRNLALTAHGNALLGRGMDIDSEEFRKSMLRYAGDLEEWRWCALRDLARLVYPTMAEPSSQALN
jgi:hypothetical protein